MDFRDLFRSFFDFSFRNDIDFEIDEHFGDSSIDNAFNGFHDHIKRHFDIIINQNESQSEQTAGNPRDLMLKSKQCDNCDTNTDNDYDETVSKNGLNSLLAKPQSPQTRNRINNDTNDGLWSTVERKPIIGDNKPYVYTKSFFYKSVVNNNGVVEEQQITKDGFGNEQQTVTQNRGDKVVTRVIKKKDNNVVEQNETIFDSENNEFADQWNQNNYNKFRDNIPFKGNSSNYYGNNSILNKFFEIFRFK